MRAISLRAFADCRHLVVVADAQLAHADLIDHRRVDVDQPQPADLHAPVAGTVVEINEVLQDEPERVNDDAFGTWLFAIRADDAAQLDALLDAGAYRQSIDA